VAPKYPDIFPGYSVHLFPTRQLSGIIYRLVSNLAETSMIFFFLSECLANITHNTKNLKQNIQVFQSLRDGGGGGDRRGLEGSDRSSYLLVVLGYR
jgi:hypothetical protein